MRSETTREFWRCFAALPISVQKAAVRAFQQFQQDAHHPSLQFKKVEGLDQTYSARVTLGYRTLGMMQRDVIVWYWIGNHAEYMRKLSS